MLIYYGLGLMMPPPKSACSWCWVNLFDPSYLQQNAVIWGYFEGDNNGPHCLVESLPSEKLVPVLQFNLTEVKVHTYRIVISDFGGNFKNVNDQCRKSGMIFFHDICSCCFSGKNNLATTKYANVCLNFIRSRSLNLSYLLNREQSKYRIFCGIFPFSHNSKGE